MNTRFRLILNSLTLIALLAVAVAMGGDWISNSDAAALAASLSAFLAAINARARGCQSAKSARRSPTYPQGEAPQ